MRNFTIYLALSLCLFASKIIAQEPVKKTEQTTQTFESRAKEIAVKIENITKEEKETLKKEIKEVNDLLEKNIITNQQAEEKKKSLAEARAVIIENRIAVVQEELKELVQQKVDGKIEEEFKRNSFAIVFNKSNGKNSEKYKKYRDSIANLSEKRTTSQFVFALGLNNAVTDGSVENSDFKFAGSRFYEWGLSYNTRIFKNDNLLHLKYGASLIYNDLRPTQNRVFVVNGDQTDLENSPINLKSSRFRNVYLVAPLHLEFDLTEKKEKDGKAYFRTHESLRFGIGGYAGVRIKSKQKTEYKIDDIDYDVKAKGDFNASNFIYGLSTYIGYKETSLYLKYDLNPLFQNNAIKQNNVSLGLRFDFN